MYHIEYRVPGYDAVQVERFDNLRQAQARYDELAGNNDATGLTQPFDPSERVVSAEPNTVGVSVSIEVPYVAD